VCVCVCVCVHVCVLIGDGVSGEGWRDGFNVFPSSTVQGAPVCRC
jgi:hypothetical protein